METNETGVCHVCKRELPLHKSYFYMSKGKWWIYRCIECSNKRNREYYRSKYPQPGQRGRPPKEPGIPRARDVSLANATDEQLAVASRGAEARIEDRIRKLVQKRLRRTL